MEYKLYAAAFFAASRSLLLKQKKNTVVFCIAYVQEQAYVPDRPIAACMPEMVRDAPCGLYANIIRRISRHNYRGSQ